MGFFSGVKDFFTGSESAAAAKDVSKENIAMTKLERDEDLRRAELGFSLSQSAGVAAMGASGVTMQGTPSIARRAAEAEYGKEVQWIKDAAQAKIKLERKGGSRAATAARTAGIGRTINTGLAVGGFF